MPADASDARKVATLSGAAGRANTRSAPGLKQPKVRSICAARTDGLLGLGQIDSLRPGQVQERREGHLAKLGPERSYFWLRYFREEALSKVIVGFSKRQGLTGCSCLSLSENTIGQPDLRTKLSGHGRLRQPLAQPQALVGPAALWDRIAIEEEIPRCSCLYIPEDLLNTIPSGGSASKVSVAELRNCRHS